MRRSGGGGVRWPTPGEAATAAAAAAAAAAQTPSCGHSHEGGQAAGQREGGAERQVNEEG